MVNTYMKMAFFAFPVDRVRNGVHDNIRHKRHKQNSMFMNIGIHKSKCLIDMIDK